MFLTGQNLCKYNVIYYDFTWGATTKRLQMVSLWLLAQVSFLIHLYLVKRTNYLTLIR